MARSVMLVIEPPVMSTLPGACKDMLPRPILLRRLVATAALATVNPDTVTILTFDIIPFVILTLLAF